MKVFEFAGIFHAGKSTMIKRLNQTLAQKGLLVKTIGKDRAVGEGFVHKDHVMARQKWVITGTICELIGVLDDSKADIVFVHRGPWDSIAFLRALVQAGEISQKEARAYITLSEQETKMIDFTVLLKVTIKESMERSWSPQSGQVDMDPVVNRRITAVMKKAYQELGKILPKGKSLILNGNRTKDENYELVLKTILRFYEESIKIPDDM